MLTVSLNAAATLQMPVKVIRSHYCKKFHFKSNTINLLDLDLDKKKLLTSQVDCKREQVENYEKK